MSSNTNDAFVSQLRDEINQKAADGKISDPIKFSEAQNMPYLQAIIREGLRLHPSFACILGREVPKGGAAVAGMYFREGVGLLLTSNSCQNY